MTRKHQIMTGSLKRANIHVNGQRIYCYRTALGTTYPLLGPLGTKNGATTPTSPHSVVKQIMGRVSE